MKDNNNLIDLIKEKKYNIALNEMEYKINKLNSLFDTK